jgi:hypothetical protein
MEDITSDETTDMLDTMVGIVKDNYKNCDKYKSKYIKYKMAYLELKAKTDEYNTENINAIYRKLASDLEDKLRTKYTAKLLREPSEELKSSEDTKRKELELKERELVLRDSEIALKKRELEALDAKKAEAIRQDIIEYNVDE